MLKNQDITPHHSIAQTLWFECVRGELRYDSLSRQSLLEMLTNAPLEEIDGDELEDAAKSSNDVFGLVMKASCARSFISKGRSVTFPRNRTDRVFCDFFVDDVPYQVRTVTGNFPFRGTVESPGDLFLKLTEYLRTTFSESGIGELAQTYIGMLSQLITNKISIEKSLVNLPSEWAMLKGELSDESLYTLARMSNILASYDRSWHAYPKNKKPRLLCVGASDLNINQLDIQLDCIN